VSAVIKLVVGLGNPGADYADTRHNAGAWFVEQIAKDFQGSLQPESKFFGLSGRVTVNGKDVRLLVPTTYMNKSGQAISAMANFFKIEPENILVAHDELDLPPGVARLKQGGGHGGHNGLRDTISSLGNIKEFGRLRIGIGHPGNAKQVTGYVLKKAPADQQKQIELAIDAAMKQLPAIINGDWGAAMNQLHSFIA
jgi:PTH1 family peptidyl-tRNA hydrolase